MSQGRANEILNWKVRLYLIKKSVVILGKETAIDFLP
jgi:hypothetical protein